MGLASFLRRMVLRVWLACALASGTGEVLSANADGTLVELQTPVGALLLRLYDQDKPITSSNFLRYVDEGRYQTAFAHRLEPGFVLQGGGYAVSNANGQSSIVSVATYGKITNEYEVGPRLSNVYGTVSMAKAPEDPNSATSQWFLNLGNNAQNLDNQNGGFTVFARVAAGTNLLDVLNHFRYDTPTNVIAVLASPLNRLPVLTTNLTYADLIYTTLRRVEAPRLTVQPLTDGGVRVQWTSVAQMTHRLETSEDGVAWTPLADRSGTGVAESYEDRRSSAVKALYRVVIPY